MAVKSITDLDVSAAKFIDDAEWLESFSKFVKVRGLTLDADAYAQVLHQTALTARLSYASTIKIQELEKQIIGKDHRIDELNQRILVMTEEINTLQNVKKQFLKIAETLINTQNTPVSDARSTSSGRHKTLQEGMG